MRRSRPGLPGCYAPPHMADGFEQAEGAQALSYPFAAVPGPGEAVEVAPGVRWLRMPLPIVLDHINVWALEDGAGWTVVDTGVRVNAIVEAWEQAFAGPLGGRPATRVICTHMHPDHVGMAGWLTQRFDVRLWMSRLEYFACRMLVADTGRPAPEDGVRFYRAAGWDEAAIEQYRARFGGFGRAVHELPMSYRRIMDGEEIVIGERAWRVVVGNGHSPEHVCLHQPELKLLIAGDQVLPKISSNVSVFPTEPDADPLGDWLSSLARLKREVPDDVLVLPAHGEPFRGLHARLDALAAGHEVSLARLLTRLDEPKRAVDVFGALFGRRIGPELLGMATGESLAHLKHLETRGQAVRETGEDGVWRWRAA